jgi:hypothetical protein
MDRLPELNAAYAAMSPWGQDLLLDIANDYAALYPAPKKQPVLALVASHGINVQSAPDLLDNGVDCSASVRVSKPVDGKKA